MFNIKTKGFTLVELLVVIVVIGILAAITIVAYSGIQQKAIEASLQSDLDNASKQLKLYQVDNGSFPLNIDCAVSGVSTNLCIKPSQGNKFTDYTADNYANPQTFSLKASNSSVAERITDSTAPVNVTANAATCPTGFIVVPGSPTYNTSDFCVMKYEAKQVGSSNVPISQPSGVPWASISQTEAMVYSQNVAGCTGCHLISEAEWLTLAQNIINVSSNWNTNNVGTGYLYAGNSSGNPGIALAASNDSDSYFGTNNNQNQRRTFTLSNGQVIWDIAGNLAEWVSKQIPKVDPDILSDWRGIGEWRSISFNPNLLPNPIPSYGTPAAANWTSAQGIGQIIYDGNNNHVVAFERSSDSYNSGMGSLGSLYMLDLRHSPSYKSIYAGFRVAR